MKGEIISFLLKKGFDITINANMIDMVLGLFSDTTEMDHTYVEIREVHRKLDALIDAPYKNAQKFIRLGNKEEALRQLVDATSKNDWCLPSRLLFIELLIDDQKFDIALEMYWEILDTFGIRTDLVPKQVIAIYLEYIKKNTVAVNPIKICNSCSLDNFFSEIKHDKLILSQNSCVIQWNYPVHRLGFLDKLIIRRLNLMKAYSLSSGGIILKVKGNKNSTILAVTNKYIVLLLDDEIRLFDARTGTKHEKILSHTEYTQLFIDSSVGEVGKYFNEINELPNIKINFEVCKHIEDDSLHTADSSLYMEKEVYVEAIIIE